MPANSVQLLRYNTTLNAFGKPEFHVVCYIYSITRAQQAKLKRMLKVARPHMPPRTSREGYRKKNAVIYLRHEIYKKYVSSVEAEIGKEGQIMCIEQCAFYMSPVAF